MKSTLFTTAILIANIKSQEYLPSVPQLVADVLSVVGAPCTADSDCDNLFNPSDISAFWSCVNDTLLPDSSTMEPFCQFTQCENSTDCATDEMCYKINTCDDNNQFYAESYELYSTVCQANALCDDIKVEGEWTSNTMCYIGEDEGRYYSEAEALLCAETCVISEELCGFTTTIDTDEDAAGCVDDGTCCTKDGWDSNGCLDLLFTEYILYTVIGLGAIVLCCCLCCCCIYKMKRKGEDYDDVDNQTNHYNVYI